MLKDALDFLAGKFEAAAEPHLVMDCPHKVVYLIGDEPVTIDKPPPPRRHRVDTIQSFVATVHCYAASGLSRRIPDRAWACKEVPGGTR